MPTTERVWPAQQAQQLDPNVLLHRPGNVYRLRERRDDRWVWDIAFITGADEIGPVASDGAPVTPGELYWAFQYECEDSERHWLLFRAASKGGTATAATEPLYRELHTLWEEVQTQTYQVSGGEHLRLGEGAAGLYLVPPGTLLPKRAPDTPPSPDPFAGRALAPFATGAPAFGAAKAILQLRQWSTDDQGRPCFVHRVDGRSFRGLFEYRIIIPADVTRREAALTHEELTRHLLGDMGWDTVWLHMLFLAFSMHTSDDRPAAITRPMVYRALGLDRRTDLSRQQKDQRCDEEIRRLGSLGLTILRAQLRGQELDYHKRSTVVWQITKDEYGQARFEPDGERLVKKWEEWQLLVQPGAWAPTFLYREPMRQFGYISPEMFNIDRRRAPWGAALAVLLAFEARFEATPRLRIPNRKIIEFAGGNPDPTTKEERRDTTQQLSNAILEQPKWGWKPDYREWPPYLRPDRDADRADGILTGDGTEATPHRRPRGYFEQLRNAATWFEVPADIYGLTPPPPGPTRRAIEKRRMAQLPAPKRAAIPAVFRAGDIRELRQRLGLTQEVFGARLGVSPSMVRFLEQGKRCPTTETSARLTALADEE